MTDVAEPKRRGRPPKQEGERKAGNLTIRTYGPLREQLEVAARASGRSVSGEVEYRLEKSFWKDDIDKQLEFERNNYSAASRLERLETMCGGRENFQFSWLIGEKLSGIRLSLGIGPETPINEISESDRRKMMGALIDALPLRFGIL